MLNGIQYIHFTLVSAQVVSVQVVDDLGYDGVGLQAQSGKGWGGGIVWVGVV